MTITHDIERLAAAGRIPSARNDYSGSSAAFLHHHACDARPTRDPRVMACACGRVWSNGKTRGGAFREVRASLNMAGYLKVQVFRRSRRVHALVAEAFLGPRPDGHQIRHLDGNNMNNRADNLAYGTAAENAGDRHRHGRTVRGTRAIHTGTVIPDAVVDVAVSRIRAGESQRAVAASLNVRQSTVWRWVHRRQRAAALTAAIHAAADGLGEP